MPLRGNLTGLRSGPMRTSSSSIRPNALLILHLDHGIPKHKYGLDGECIESNPEEKGLVRLVVKKHSVPWQCVHGAQKANCIRGCFKSSMASRWMKVILPLCSALVRPYLKYCAQLWDSQQKEMDLLKLDQRRP
ncbi:hypothetical protein BTVI_54814 [Pitangus sulphuratus]|nr:hypothetical protein BTVI_54814 [Pitangus sulphuratus]